MADSGTYAELTFDRPLDAVDPLVDDLIGREATRQRDKLIMIPSESLTPLPVRQALASPFTSVYAEGYPAGPMLRDDEAALADLDWQLARFRRYGDRRYYRGADFANVVEALARRRCAEAFATPGVPPSGLHVNVQPLSGAAANNAVYEALLKPGEGIMGLALAHGGHLTHGASVNRSGIRYRGVPYSLASPDARLDYDAIEALALREKPRIIVAGYTSYPWAPDWARFRAIADRVGAYLMADISHPAGMVAAGAYPSPVGSADVVTFTTHKTLCGPRAAVILSHRADVMRAIDRAVFPGEQGGPHLNKIAAMAVAFGLARTPAFVRLQRQIVANAAALAAALERRGVGLAYGGTDTHLLVVNLRKCGAAGDLRGEPAVRMLDLIGIVANRNSLPGDPGFAAPTGVRLGTPWLTQRGYAEADMDELSAILACAFGCMTGIRYPGATQPRYRGRMAYGELGGARQRPRRPATDGSTAVIAHDSLIRLRETVRAFAARGRGEAVPAAREPLRAASLIEVRGPRAPIFVDQVANRRTRDLAPGEVRHAGIATGPSSPPVGALVFQPDGLTTGRHRRLWLVADGAIGPELAEWLQAVSDGYVLVDRDKPSRKVDGPVAVTAGPLCPEPMEAIGVAASDARTLTGLAGDGATQLTLDGTPAWVLVAGESAAVVARAPALPAVQRALADRDVDLASIGPPPAADVRRPFFVGRSAQLPAAKPADRPAFGWTEPAGAPLHRTPLHPFHAQHAKKLMTFGGWDMPVWYTSIEQEHRAVRTAAGLFDVGHMGVFGISGPHAAELLDVVVTGSASRVPPGRALYTYLLDPTGHCLDDLIIYRAGPEKFLAVVNAANAAKDWAWLQGVNEGRYALEPGDPWATCPVRATLDDLKDPELGDRRRMDVALQGPKARTVLQRLAAAAEDRDALAAMRPNDFRRVRLAGVDVEIAHTGYTGEPVGFEIFVHPDAARALWDAILTAGADAGVVPTALGARDSTRTEAGFPLYGHELAGQLDLTPGDAGFGSFVKVYKPFFSGRTGFLAREAKREAQVVRFTIAEDRAPMARPGDPCVDTHGTFVGTVTSAALDTNGRQVGMAHVALRVAAETTRLQVFAGATARSAGQAIAPRDLRPGSRYPLPVDAHVIARFRR